MAKLPEEVMKQIYDAGYAAGKADACRELSDTIRFLAKAAYKALDDVIKECEEQKR